MISFESQDATNISKDTYSVLKTGGVNLSLSWIHLNQYHILLTHKVATFRKGVRAIQLVGRASEFWPNIFHSVPQQHTTWLHSQCLKYKRFHTYLVLRQSRLKLGSSLYFNHCTNSYWLYAA